MTKKKNKKNNNKKNIVKKEENKKNKVLLWFDRNYKRIIALLGGVIVLESAFIARCNQKNIIINEESSTSNADDCDHECVAETNTEYIVIEVPVVKEKIVCINEEDEEKTSLNEEKYESKNNLTEEKNLVKKEPVLPEASLNNDQNYNEIISDNYVPTPQIPQTPAPDTPSTDSTDQDDQQENKEDRVNVEEDMFGQPTINEGDLITFPDEEEETEKTNELIEELTNLKSALEKIYNNDNLLKLKM